MKYTMKKMFFSILLALFAFFATATAQCRYDMKTIQREKLNRGVVAVKSRMGKVYVTWRSLGSDKKGEPFQVYRNGELLTKKALTTGGTFFEDKKPLTNQDATYEVRGGGLNGSYTLRADAPAGYIAIPLEKPQGGMTPDSVTYDYVANDCSIGDVDGDGQYEIFLKWEPTNYKDNSHDGFTGNVFIDCYTLEGKRLWRIDLGKNIRAGAHYTQFMVYDFDGDGKAEMMCKTADGTTDGTGAVIGDASKDWRRPVPTATNPNKRKQEKHQMGRILDGPEFLTVFDGKTGRNLCTVDYVPSRGSVNVWGDEYGNRVDRFLAGVAYLDGKRPSAVFCRGYYSRTVIAAWDWDGRQLRQHWVFDTDQPEWNSYAGQGNHNLRIADFDGDGCDEICIGSMAVDHDGRGLYNTGFGHGDAIHLVPEPDGKLYIWDCHENKRDGVDLREAATGKIIFQHSLPNDVGRCLAADIDPTNPGHELWSISEKGIYNTKGEVLHDTMPDKLTINFAIWWDGDLLREQLDRAAVYKYDYEQNKVKRIARFDGCAFNNHTKSNPCLQADILGDWREEVVTRTKDSDELRIYVSGSPTQYRITCLEEDIPYRLSVATQNVGYNQPPEPGFYLGPDNMSYLK